MPNHPLISAQLRKIVQCPNLYKKLCWHVKMICVCGRSHLCPYQVWSDHSVIDWRANTLTFPGLPLPSLTPDTRKHIPSDFFSSFPELNPWELFTAKAFKRNHATRKEQIQRRLSYQLRPSSLTRIVEAREWLSVDPLQEFSSVFPAPYFKSSLKNDFSTKVLTCFLTDALSPNPRTWACAAPVLFSLEGMKISILYELETSKQADYPKFFRIIWTDSLMY